MPCPMADVAARVPPWLVASAGGIGARGAVGRSRSPPTLALGPSVKWTGSYTLAIVALALWVIPGSVAWLAWRPRRRTARSL